MPAPSRPVMRMRPMAIEPLWCVVPAAGLGARFGAQLPKQYVVIGDRPVLLWTLQRLAQCRCIAGLLVVLAADDTLWPDINLVAGKPVLTAIGASDRGGSVLAGLRALPDSVAADTFVLVHDAARPCVSCADIDSLIANAGPAGGGLLAARMHDTLKRGDGDAGVAGGLGEGADRESRGCGLAGGPPAVVDQRSRPRVDVEQHLAEVHGGDAVDEDLV